MEARLRVGTCRPVWGPIFEEMVADFRMELLQYIENLLSVTQNRRYDHRALAQLRATAGTSTFVRRRIRRRSGMPVESVDFCASRCDAHARSSFFRTSHGFCELNPSDTPHRQVRCCQAKSLESKDPTCLREGGEPGSPPDAYPLSGVLRRLRAHQQVRRRNKVCRRPTLASARSTHDAATC